MPPKHAPRSNWSAVSWHHISNLLPVFSSRRLLKAITAHISSIDHSMCVLVSCYSDAVSFMCVCSIKHSVLSSAIWLFVYFFHLYRYRSICQLVTCPVISEKTLPIQQIPNPGAREGVPLQYVSNERSEARGSSLAELDGATSENMVSKSTDENEENE